METKSPALFRIEACLACLTGFLFVLTLLWRDWIEEVFGADPDGGSGLVEWLVVGGLLLACIAFSLLARSERRRLQPGG